MLPKAFRILYFSPDACRATRPHVEWRIQRSRGRWWEKWWGGHCTPSAGGYYLFTSKSFLIMQEFMLVHQVKTVNKFRYCSFFLISRSKLPNVFHLTVISFCSHNELVITSFAWKNIKNLNEPTFLTTINCAQSSLEFEIQVIVSLHSSHYARECKEDLNFEL